MTNIEEMAVQTFSVVPEAYQQVFIENGADFPDELVSAIKEDPEKASELLNNDKQLKSAVVNVFKSNKESILQAVQQAQNPVSVNKYGGKLLGVMKFQLGGKYSVKNGDYSASVQAPGDTLRTKVYPYTTREMQTYPNGNVRYTIFRKSDTQNFWSPQSKPNFLQKLWYGNRTVPADEAQNWEQIIRNHPEDPRNVLKKQFGGAISQKLQSLLPIENASIPEESGLAYTEEFLPNGLKRSIRLPIEGGEYEKADTVITAIKKLPILGKTPIHIQSPYSGYIPSMDVNDWKEVNNEFDKAKVARFQAEVRKLNKIGTKQ